MKVVDFPNWIEAGDALNDEMVSPAEAVTSRVVTELAERPEESVTVTFTWKLPVCEGVQPRVDWLKEVHPDGRPV